MAKMNTTYVLDMKNWYQESKLTILNAKLFIVLSFLIFCIGTVLGHQSLGDTTLIRDRFIEIFQKSHSISYLSFFIKVLLHNAIVAYLSMRLGILLGIVPAISGIASGISIGWLFANVKSVHYLKLLLILLPHGLIEIFAMSIAWGIGLWQCKLLFVPNYEKVSKENAIKINKLFITIVLPLLVIAASIEGWPLLFR